MKVKNFRACNELFNHVLDGHIIAAVAAECNVRSWQEVRQILTETSWRIIIKDIRDKKSNLQKVGKLRESKDKDRDILHENALLFLQHGLMYRDFCNAMRFGDSGRVIHCLVYFAIWFQGSGLSNYAWEIMHMVTCVRHTWSEEMVEFWKNNCLLNPSGSPKGFMAFDYLCEHFVREHKLRMPTSPNPAQDRYHREVHSPQLMTYRDARERMLKESGAIHYYMHSSVVDPTLDVQTIAEHLISEGVFYCRGGRTGFTDKAAADLHEIGTGKMYSGQPIADYKLKVVTSMMGAGDTSAEDDEMPEPESVYDNDDDLIDFVEQP